MTNIHLEYAEDVMIWNLPEQKYIKDTYVMHWNMEKHSLKL